MRHLRQCEQRYHEHLDPLAPVPLAAKQPSTLVPNAAVPKQFLDIGEQPKCCEKDEPVGRERFINRPCTLTPDTSVHIDESKVRDAVNDHIRNGKRIV